MIRQAIVVGLVSTLATGLYGYPPPVDASTLPAFGVSLGLLAGYIYLLRTLFRLPVGVWGGWRRYRHAREHYELGLRGALAEGFYRGFLDRRQWESGTLAILDRFWFFGVVWVACQPGLGPVLVRGGGVMGVLLLVTIYLGSGQFGGLLEDGLGTTRKRPFGRIPNLRRPPDDF